MRESIRLGMAVGAIGVGLLAMAAAGHLQATTAPVLLRLSSGVPERARRQTSGIHGTGAVDYRAAAKLLVAEKGNSAIFRADGGVKHYLPKLREQRLDEEPAAEDEKNSEGNAGSPSERPVVPLQEVDFMPPEGIDYKVPVEVYMESQGQASKLFTEWVLVQVVGAPGMVSIINLLMFPWGQCSVINKDIKRPVNVDVEYLDNYTSTNVTLRSGWPAFLCEHGPSECEGNAIMSCVNALYPDLRQWFRVDACIVARTCADGEAPLVDAVAHTGATQTSVCAGLPVDVAPGCIREFGGDMDLRKIDQCVKGKQGTELLLQNMVQTKTLVPPIQVLPWILVDQEVLNWPNRSNIFLLGKTICDAYIRKVQPYVNGSVPRPLGCFYFPTEPPYMPPITLWDEQGILWLWVGGGICFLLGVCILVGWKLYATQHALSYDRLEGHDGADRGSSQ